MPDLVVGAPGDEFGAGRIWRQYWRGLAARYGEHGVAALAEPEAEEPAFTRPDAVFVALEGERVVGGLRLHMPGRVDRLPVTADRADLPLEVADSVAKHSPDGVNEIKGLWASRDVAGHGVSTALLRASVELHQMSPERWLLAIANQYSLPALERVGWVRDEAVAPFPYPDDRYLTRALWLDGWEAARP